MWATDFFGFGIKMFSGCYARLVLLLSRSCAERKERKGRVQERQMLGDRYEVHTRASESTTARSCHRSWLFSLMQCTRTPIVDKARRGVTTTESFGSTRLSTFKKLGLWVLGQYSGIKKQVLYWSTCFLTFLHALLQHEKPPFFAPVSKGLWQMSLLYFNQPIFSEM